MGLEFIANHARRVSCVSAIALGVSIPVSTALDNVLMVVTLAAWALSGQVHETGNFSFKNKVLLYSISLFGLLTLGTLYGESPAREALAYLWKYADLLFIPLFAMVFSEHETRRKALLAMAVTIAVTVVLSYLIRFGMFPATPFTTGVASSPTVFKLKITHSILAAFGAFLFAWLGYTAANRRLRVIWYALSLLAALNVLLLVKGATGYVILGALIILLGWERVGSRGMAYAVFGLAVIVPVLAIAPNPFRERVSLIRQEIQDWRADKESSEPSSTGLRLESYKNTLAIIAAVPLTGVGTGGFPMAYAQQVKNTGKPETHNPHNEFLNIAAQIGIIGLLVLIAMFWMQWRTAKYLNTPMEQSLARGLVLTMVAGCMVNSLLLDHTEGLFYAWLSGLLYGGLKYGQPDNAASHT